MWLDTQQDRIKDDLDSRIAKVLGHKQFINGPEVSDLEYQLSKYVGTKFAVGCSSGTDALLMSLMAHGIKGPECAIFTTPFTFISTAEVISLLGAQVFFVDIDPTTFNIDAVKLDETLDMLKPRTTTGIIAVDMFGLPSDYESINEIAEFNNAFVIEDAAQSLGGEMNGKKAGGLASIGCTSFFPSKPLGCYGDGGMCFTDDAEFHYLLNSIKMHGQAAYGKKYNNQRIGINGRLDTIQAAVLLSKLQIFEDEIDKRQEVAKRYNSLLKDINSIKIPQIPSEFKSAWAQYSILFESEDARNNVSNKLQNEGIETAIYYPRPLHIQGAFKDCCYNIGDFPVSEMYAKTILSLPMHPYVEMSEQQKIAEVINENVDV